MERLMNRFMLLSEEQGNTTLTNRTLFDSDSNRRFRPCTHAIEGNRAGTGRECWSGEQNGDVVTAFGKNHRKSCCSRR
jgi:hypothetical protein